MELAIEEIKARIDTLNRQVEINESEAEDCDIQATHARSRASKCRKLRESYSDVLLQARPNPSKDAD